MQKKKPKITTYCGLDCDICEYKEPCNCEGCVATEGKPFHGHCDVAELVSFARDGVDPIAYCGFSCNHCFLGQWCGSCRSDYNCCSYATICEGGVCQNVSCCQDKQIDGCYECEDLIDCEKGFYTKGNDGADSCKAQAIFISRYGKEAILKVHDKLHEEYPSFKKTQEVLGNNVQEGLERLEKYL